MGAERGAQSGPDGSRHRLDNHAEGGQAARDLRLPRARHRLLSAHHAHADVLPHLPQQRPAGKSGLPSAGGNLHGSKIGLWSQLAVCYSNSVIMY